MDEDLLARISRPGYLMSTALEMRSPEEKESQRSSPTLEAASLEQKASTTGEDEIEFPDGGLEAWLVVIGGVICNIVSFGTVVSYGVFQSYYTQVLLPNESPSNLAWVGSLQAMLLLFPSLFGGALFDAGWFRLPLLISSAAFILFTFLTAQCTKFWHFILCQGIASGFALGMIFGPVMTVVAHWWGKRRGLAFGVVLLGASTGGVVIPIMVRQLIPKVGFPWTMRILGFTFLALLAIANLTMKTRLPAVPRKGLKAIWDNDMFTKNPVYTLTCIGGFFGFLGVYTVMIFVAISAVQHGVDDVFASYLVAILNGAAALGRFGSGKLADSTGFGTASIPGGIIATAVSFGFPFATEKRHFIAIAIFYGIGSGAFTAAFMPSVYELGDMSNLGVRVGMAMVVISLSSLAGGPISGELIGRYGYSAAGYFAGTAMALAVIFMLVARHVHLKGNLKGRY